MDHMKKLWVSLALLCIPFYFNFSQAQSSVSWAGEYLYQGTAGRTYGGSIVGEEIWLTINQDGSCTLMEYGWMQSKKINCQTIDRKNALEVVYLSLTSQDGHDQWPEHRVAPYKSGDVLFSLEKTSDKGKLITHWRKILAYGIKEKIEHYFEPIY